MPTKKTTNGIHELNREIRENFANLIAHNLPQLHADLRALSARDRLRIVIDMAKYVLPTFRSVEVIDEREASFQPFTITLQRNEPVEIQDHPNPEPK
jgi:hypothetical protein